MESEICKASKSINPVYSGHFYFFFGRKEKYSILLKSKIKKES